MIIFRTIGLKILKYVRMSKKVCVKNYVGLILKRYTTRQNRIAILDKHLGRIEGFLIADVISVGTLMQYTVQPCNNGFFLKNTEIIYLPLELAQIDLLFLHHTFELCYYFVPVGSCVLGIFDLFTFLYSAKQVWVNRYLKKIFLFKLLTTFGMYAEYGNICKTCFHYLIATPIDKLNGELIDLDCKKSLRNWLYRCVKQHPTSNEFKTMNFLSEN